MKKILKWLTYFEKFVDRPWYSPALGFCAAIDHYVIVFPIVSLLVSSIFLAHRKWLSLTVWTAIGSWFGAWCLAFIARYFGLSFIEMHFPDMFQSLAWEWAHSFFYQHGVWLVFLMGLLPIPQQPPVIIAALAGAPLYQIGGVLLVARLIKFLLIGYLASHAPQKLMKFKEISREIEELHVKPPETSSQDSLST